MAVEEGNAAAASSGAESGNTSGQEGGQFSTSLDGDQGGQQASGDQGDNPGGQGGSDGGGEAASQGGESAGNPDSSGGGDSGGAEGAPESYADFNMPEDTQLDQATLDKAMPLFKDLKLSQENAQKLVDFYNEQMSGQRIQTLVTEAQTAINQSRAQGWLERLKTDPEIGGSRYDESAKLANKAMQAFSTPALWELVNEFGLGNHPEMIRVFSKIGAAMGEHGFQGGHEGGGQGEKPDIVTKLYGPQGGKL